MGGRGGGNLFIKMIQINTLAKILEKEEQNEAVMIYLNRKKSYRTVHILFIKTY